MYELNQRDYLEVIQFILFRNAIVIQIELSVRISYEFCYCSFYSSENIDGAISYKLSTDYHVTRHLVLCKVQQQQ